MKNNSFNKHMFFSLQNMILNKILIFTAIGGFSSGVLNLINIRPISNIFASFGVSIFSLFLYKLSKNKKYFDKIRILYIIIFCNIYIPFGWLISPGSESAFPYYTIALIVISSMLIKGHKELLFPLLAVVEVPLLLRYEALNPDKFYQYTDKLYRANDLTLNFSLLIIILIYLIFIVNKYTSERDEVLYYFSITDQLTGLYNRRHLFNYLEILIKESKDFTIAMIDINKFKQINDNYGHIVGDKVLIATGSLLNDFHKSDIVCGRYGGDEFMIIFPNKSLAESINLLKELELGFSKLSKEFQDIDITFSYGLSENKHKSIEEIIHYADTHLYKKKSVNKNKFN